MKFPYISTQNFYYDAHSAFLGMTDSCQLIVGRKKRSIINVN